MTVPAVCLIAFAIAQPPFPGGAGGAVNDADPKAKDTIRKMLDDQVASWNKGDLDGFMVAYWNDDKLSFFSGGTVSHGWKALKDRYQARYFDPGKDRGTLKFDDIDVEMIGDNAAMVRGRWKTTMKDVASEGLYTLIVKKVGNQWRIVHDHTSSKS